MALVNPASGYIICTVRIEEGAMKISNILSLNDSQAPRAATLEPSLRRRGITSPEKTVIAMDPRSMTSSLYFKIVC